MTDVKKIIVDQIIYYLQNLDDNAITVILKYNVKDTGITDQIQIAFQ